MARLLLILLLALQPMLYVRSAGIHAVATQTSADATRCCGDTCCCGDDGCLCSLVPVKREQPPKPAPAPAPEQARMLLWLPPRPQLPSAESQSAHRWRAPTSDRAWQTPGHRAQAAHCIWHT